MAAAPESDSSPTSSPALVLAVAPVLVMPSCSMTSRPLPASGPFARRLACRRRALDDREENPHSIDTRLPVGYSGQSNRAQMVRLVWSPSMPHSSATARTMSRP